jgi:hypothetical protein
MQQVKIYTHIAADSSAYIPGIFGEFLKSSNSPNAEKVQDFDPHVLISTRTLQICLGLDFFQTLVIANARR